MTNNEKQAIAARLKNYCDQKGSQNKAAKSLGISSATVSKVLANDWETIRDDMWRSIAARTGHDATQWAIVRTSAYDRMTFLLTQAQEESLVLGVIGFAGCGKTEAIKNYTAGHRDVYHLCCSEYWTMRTFIGKLSKCLGMDIAGSTSEQMEAIVERLQAVDTPLIVLDEADKLKDPVLYFFISLYNQLEGQCGIMLCATDYLQKRIERGLRFGRKGYEEIHSRIGRRFIKLDVINEGDIVAVCKANGVTDSQTIKNIVADADSDLRRVKRAVWAAKKGGAQ